MFVVLPLVAVLYSAISQITMPRKQGTTKFPVRVLGGVKSLRGNFILADLDWVEDETWWQDHGQNVGVTVCCLRQNEVTYPPGAAKSQICYVDPNSKLRRGPSFDEAVPVVKESFELGYDVLVHCRQSYHRGPLVTAALMQAICGVDYQVVHNQISIYTLSKDINTSRHKRYPTSSKALQFSVFLSPYCCTKARSVHRVFALTSWCNVSRTGCSVV